MFIALQQPLIFSSRGATSAHATRIDSGLGNALTPRDHVADASRRRSGEGFSGAARRFRHCEISDWRRCRAVTAERFARDNDHHEFLSSFATMNENLLL